MDENCVMMMGGEEAEVPMKDKDSDKKWRETWLTVTRSVPNLEFKFITLFVRCS